MESSFLNVAGGAGATTGASSGGIGGYGAIISLVADLGIQYLYAKKDNKRNQELLQRLSELNEQEAEKLKKLLETSLGEVAKTQVILEFLNEKKIQDLQDETKKKRTISYIVFGVGVVVLGLIFFKLNRQNG
jgi:hypothetical protein